LSEKDLEGYYVSYIRPTFPLRLLDFVTEHEIYGATADIAHGSNLREAEDFSNQVQEHCDVDGIMYTSKYNEAGINAVLFQRCQNHFTDDSYIHTERLCETIRPMKEVLENRVGLKFLL
jgi:hypothetical protein